MPDLDLWLKGSDANCVFKGLSVTETKTLKDYFHGKLSPEEAASEFVKNFDLEPKGSNDSSKTTKFF